MPSPKPATVTHQRDWWVTAGIAVSATAALVSSFSGLRALAIATGWSVYLAPLLPLCIDSYATTAVRVWLGSGALALRARRFARANALGAIALSVGGNAAWHLIAARLLSVNWVLVVAVGSLPPLILGQVTHLAALMRHPTNPEAAPPVLPAVPSTDPVQAKPTAVRTRAELLALARQADAAWRTEHGRGITRDGLRAALHVGAKKATELLRQLRAEETDHVDHSTT